MCGRYSRPIDLRFLFPHLPGLVIAESIFSGGVMNVAPSQQLPIVIFEDVPKVVCARWGFMPAWADPARMKPQINARAEGLADKPMFRAAFKARRCLIPADGYFEWKQDGESKTPYYFRLKSREPFVFAGLWEPDKNGDKTFAIITTAANEQTTPYHHRMPVMLRGEDCQAWLNTREFDRERLMALLGSVMPGEVEIFPVSRLVNNPRNDSPEIFT